LVMTSLLPGKSTSGYDSGVKLQPRERMVKHL
jgi:hypothetical protein